MHLSRTKHLSTAAAICLAFFLLLSAKAEAEKCPVDYYKGSTAELSTRIDPSSYADGSMYDNVPPEVNKIRVGVQYGRNLSDVAYFYSDSDNSWRFGYYDEARSFVPVYHA